ncbi:exported hypothetical protein [Paraburkholderia piptadeniae]|uniref:Uncharacterized protein n=1 Tax=Paraburkholderia piptadeniae TaxID=1701573 RepID=A0A1N7STK9_9BURK|nr:exported hypothetical protein [Paraburkholderia piptadeniae]
MARVVSVKAAATVAALDQAAVTAVAADTRNQRTTPRAVPPEQQSRNAQTLPGPHWR